MLIKNKRS